MDPLSITASIITLADAGTIGKGVAKVLEIRNAPQILLGLNNEIADLYYVVQDIDNFLKRHTETIPSTFATSLSRALEKGSRTLSTLENLVAYELTTIKGKENELRLDRSRWLRAEPKVQQMKDEIRDDRIWLVSILSLLVSSQLQHMSYTVESLEMRTDLILGGMQSIEGLVRDTQENSYRQSHTLRSLEHNFTQLRIAPEARLHNSTSTNFDVVQGLAANNSDVYERRQRSNQAQPYAMRLSLARQSCSLDCDCACHQRNKFRNSAFVDAFLGSLIIGYKASPRAGKRCNNTDCQIQTIRINYTFPRWFWSRAVSVAMSSSYLKGPELCLRLLKTRPWDAGIFAVFLYLREERVHHIKRLLEDGKASVLDVDPDGDTPLHHAVMATDLGAAQMLVRAGALMLYENAQGLSPYTLVWRMVLGWPQSQSLDLWRDLFSDRSQLEECNFPNLHKAYFNISGKTFQSVLIQTQRSVIDQVDGLGRTLLSWAAQRGDYETVQQLLASGADPDRPDLEGKTPLHWSASAVGASCMQALLYAKADVNARTRDGDTALYWVVGTQEDSREYIRTLLDYGADINSQNTFGSTPLHQASRRNRSMNLSYLISMGANINGVTSEGYTALTLAICFRSHDALRILVENSLLDWAAVDLSENTVLHDAALSGDLQTLKILKLSEGLNDIDVTARDGNRWTATECARWRRDFNQDWSDWAMIPRDHGPEECYAAFEALVDEIVSQKERVFEGSNEVVATMEDPDNQEVWEDALEWANDCAGDPAMDLTPLETEKPDTSTARNELETNRKRAKKAETR